MKKRGDILHECLQRHGLVGAMLHDGDAYEQAAAEYDKVQAQPSSDLEQARELYFSLGGLESDIGPRDDSAWYWRRAAKIVSERLAKQANEARTQLPDNVEAFVREVEGRATSIRADAWPNVIDIIARYRTDVPRLIAIVREQRARIAALEGPPAPGMSNVRMLVLHKRDDAPWAVYPFNTFTEARIAYEQFASSWTGTFLVRIVMGPHEEVQAEAPYMPRIFDELITERDTLRERLALVEHERDEARDWVRRLTHETRVLTCAYCGETYPPNTPESNHAALNAHVKACAKHPMRNVERERDVICERLAKLEALFVRVRNHWGPGASSENCDCTGCAIIRDIDGELNEKGGT